MTSSHWVVSVCTLFCTLDVITSFTDKKEFDYHCNEIYTLGIDGSYTINVYSYNQFQHESCEIGFQGYGTNMIDTCRVCVDVIDAVNMCNGFIAFRQGGRGKDSKRNRVTYNCTDLPSHWCGEIETIVYIDLGRVQMMNTSQSPLKLKVILESSYAYMKSIAVILSLILGAIVITIVVSCLIRCSTRRRKRLTSLSSQCPEDGNYGSNQTLNAKEKEERSNHSKIFSTSYHNRIHAPCISYMNLPAPPPYTTLHNSHNSDRVGRNGVAHNNGFAASTAPPPPYTVR